MRTLLSFFILSTIKIFSKIFYKLEVNWVSELQTFEKIRLVILLNHTSLYEPLYIAAAPNGFIWRIARKMVAPGADKTLDRPIVGFFWKIMAPGIMSITRKRDKSWFQFLKAIENKSVILIAPEGRMKRNTGLDSNGKPMSVRSGVAEIINELNEGRIMIAYSGGLHHVQHPGELLPRLFQDLKLNLEVLDTVDYKKSIGTEGIQFRKDVVADLERRLQKFCPELENNDVVSAS